MAKNYPFDSAKLQNPAQAHDAMNESLLHMGKNLS